MQVKHIRPVFLIVGLAILGVALAFMIKETFSRDVPSTVPPAGITEDAPFKISSPVFDDNGQIPNEYTCIGAGRRIPVSIQNPPSNVKQYALVMHDTSTNGGGHTHWLAWKIPAVTTSIPENLLPEGTVEGTNDSQKTGYEAPCPTADGGERQYTFDLYALNEEINLDSRTTKDELIAAINGKVITKVQLVGTATAKQ